MRKVVYCRRILYQKKGRRFLRYNLILYITVVLLQLIITNISLLDGYWNGITMWLSTTFFIFATTIFLLSKLQGQKAKH